MTKTEILVFHPQLEKSNSNALLAKEAQQKSGVNVRDMYRVYPNGVIDVKQEQKILEEADHIILQFPMYWYSGPAFMKQWLDEVLAYGWAYGVEETVLEGKVLSLVVTLGGSAKEYRENGKAGHTVEEFLLPIRATGRYVGLTYGETFVIDGTLSQAELVKTVQQYVSAIGESSVHSE